MRHATVWRYGALTLAAACGTALAAGEAGAEEGYRGHKLVEIHVTSKAHLDQIEQFGSCMACRAGSGPHLFVVAPEKMDALSRAAGPLIVQHDDVQTLIDAEATAMQAQREAADVRARAGVDTFFDTYRTYTEINTRLAELVALRSDLCTAFIAGTSIEGRQLHGIRIANLDPGDPAADEAATPGFVVQGGQHAREWIGPASVMYLADTLVRDYGVDPVVTDLVDDVVFYIIPIVNPDGYNYTFPVAQGGNNVRLWRKNRRNNGGSFGVDLNRNWSVGWGGTNGASPIPSNDTYHGLGPFSEPEASGVSSYMSTLPNVKAHLDIHSYSQLILGPWGYTETTCPPREAELRAVQESMESVMDATHSVDYTAGLGCDQLLYEATGTAPDWSFQTLDALAWTYELRDTGAFGFELPASQIIPTSEEVFNGVRTLAEHIQLQLGIATSGLPDPVPADESVAFGVAITAFNGESYESGTAMVHWRLGNTGPFTSELLSGGDPQNLTGSLPAAPCNTEIQYYFSAETTDGATVFEPEDGPADPFSTIVTELTVAADDTAEINAGWTVGAPGDAATLGIWNRMNPQGTAAQPEDDHTVSGTMCWVTDGNAGTSVGSFDVDGGATTLLSPIYDLSASAEAQVSYWRWYSNNAGAAPNADTFRVSISNNGGSSWTLVETVGPTGPETSGGWIQKIFNVQDYVATSSQVRLRFVADDAGAGSVVEAAIDDVRIISLEVCETPTTCPGDATGDNIVDLNDLSNVLFAFGQSVPAGTGPDVAGNDGVVDLADLSLILFNFGNAC